MVEDGARIYWRLGDAPGSTSAQDSAAFQTGAANAMTFGRPGAILGDTDTAASPDSTSGRVVQPQFINYQGQPERHPVRDVFSTEVWFRTTSTSGGRLLGFGNSNSGTSGSSTADRVLYVTNTGRVMFGVRTRAEGTGYTTSRTNRTIQSNSGLNDGEWHHAVGSLDSTGMRLFIDGEQVATRSDVNSGHGYYGYWRVGADTLNNWGSAPSSTRLNGDIDEAAVYDEALTPTQIANHYAASGRGTIANEAPTASFTATPSGLSVAVNGSGSTDSDGSIVSHAWTFGDGGTASGANPAAHVYASAGTYTITLSVTDDDGAVGVSTQSVTVTPAPNALPTASFTATPSGLSVAVNGSGSTDSDGSIVSYAWTFGDGGTATGATPLAHAYATGGTYPVTLTVTDDDGGVGVATQSVTVTPPPNAVPTASFTATPSGLSVAVNGSGSTDSDGSIVSYAWTFGDGGTATGAIPAAHVYATGGTYPVTLTVTDDDGGVGVATQSVTVTQPGEPVVVARDLFGRTVANAWGPADLGGAWTFSGTAANFSVSGGVGRIVLPTAGVSRSSTLASVSVADVDQLVDLTLDKGPTGGGVYVSSVVRKVGNTEFRLRAYLRPTGSTLQLMRVVSGTETVLASATLPGVYAAGDVMHLRLRVVGSGTSTLQGKLWFGSQTEPVGWQVQTTDATAALQGPGGVGVHAYISASSTNAPVTMTVDNLVTSALGATPPPNVQPMASFTATPSGLSVAVNGSGSTDSDGSIVSYAWTFGDGGTASWCHPGCARLRDRGDLPDDVDGDR